MLAVLKIVIRFPQKRGRVRETTWKGTFQGYQGRIYTPLGISIKKNLFLRTCIGSVGGRDWDKNKATNTGYN